MNLPPFTTRCQPKQKSIRTFSILFGDADEKSMAAIAELTNVYMFNAKSESLV